MPWHALAPPEVAKRIGTSLDNGLSDEEAAARAARLGANKLTESKPVPLWRRFLAQISDFTVLALLAAAAIAGTLGALGPSEPGQGLLARFGDSLAILAIVILNAVLGLVQEQRAERALEALKNMTAPTARVRRGGRILDVPAADLVVGDVVHLEEGDRIAADLRLAEASSLEVEEAALTGESQPVTKNAAAKMEPETALADRRTMAFMGTQVVRGRARGVVVATGMGTELGSIAGMLAEVEDEETPLEQDLERFGKQVVIGCVVISLVVFAVGLFMAHRHGHPLGTAARELFLVAVALAVAAIPEGLPAITTIVLALGTQRMARRNALVRRLPAVETLGCTQIICTDKTGTLTQNTMSARRLRVGGVLYEVDLAATGDPFRALDGEAFERDFRLLLFAAAHVTGARLVSLENGRVKAEGDPTDGALLMLASRGADHDRSGPQQVDSERPFTSERRMASITLNERGQARSYVRGAPEVIISRCTTVRRGGVSHPLDPEERKALLDEATAWAGEAMRVIAMAFKDGKGDPESELTFLALVGIVDPPRPEVKAAIAEARGAGIHTIMITGDHPATGRAIGREIGLLEEGDLLLTGGEMDAMPEGALVEKVERVRVVARATAEHKLRIVEALKSRGVVCAMTGDGVNDAPAVKAATIGVAMGRAGTDVTKEAADLVLADDNYATIVAAVEEGRAIYANIRKFVFFLLSSNAGIVLVVLAASLLGWHSPLAPIQILWINLITNGLPALALGVDKPDGDQMREPPRQPGGAILTKREYVEVLLVGVVMAVTAMWAFHVALVEAGGAGEDVRLGITELDRARTVCFSILAIGPLLHALNCRSKTKSLFRVGVFTNRALWGAIVVGVILQAVTIYVPFLRPLFRTVPLDGEGALWIAAMSLFPFVLGELVKIVGAVPSVKGKVAAGQ